MCDKLTKTIEARHAAEDRIVKAARKAMAHKALTVACPTCRSLPGYKCVTLGRRGHYTTTHRARFTCGNAAQLKG